jgi:hypothetical protein
LVLVFQRFIVQVFKEVTDRVLNEHGGDSTQMDDALEKWMQCVFPRKQIVEIIVGCVSVMLF